MEIGHAFVDGLFGFAEHIVQFNGGEAFDMEVGAVGPDLADEIGKELEVHLGMNAANDMNFGNWLTVVALYDIEHLFGAELPAFFAVGVEARVGAELTGEHTHIGGLDMEITIEIGFVSVQSFSYKIGEGSNEGKAGMFKKIEAVFRSDAFLADYLFCDGLKGSVRFGGD